MRFQRSCLMAVGAMFFLFSMGLMTSPARARGVVRIERPPTIVISTAPALVVVPGTNVYVAPEVSGDIVFYQGFWWRLYGGHWFRSNHYSGSWVYVSHSRVPHVLYGFHSGFRHSYSKSPRLHNRDVMHNWRKWERDRHWDRRH